MALQKQLSCRELVSFQWKRRQEEFSWGGPSDELRAFVNRDDSIHRLEYWYMDWFDGAHVNVPAEHDAWTKMQEMILSTAPGQVANS